MPHLTASRFNKCWGQLLEEIQYLVKVVSTKTKCTTFDELRYENNTRKKASLINLPVSRVIYIAVSLTYKNKIVYLTKLEVTQIYATPYEKLMVTLGLDKTRCCYQSYNIISWDMGANENAPNNASAKKWSRLHLVS